MNLIDSFKLSLNSILHRKLRSWLTLLGIIIGVAAVVSIISIGQGAQASVAERLSGLGADLLTVSPGFDRAGGFGGGFREGRLPDERSQTTSVTEQPTLTKRDSVVIKGNPNVLYVNETVSGRAELVFLAEKSNVNIQGVNPNTWKEMANLELDSGRFLSASDSTAIVIGYRLANERFKQKITLGRRLTIGERAFTVVGIIEQSGESFGMGNSDSAVYMPFESAWDITDVERDTFSSIQVKVSDASLVESTTAELTEALLLSRKVTEKTKNFSITSSQAMQEQIAATTQTLTLFLGAIAAISLLVGAIGVANSMFTSVLEKTRLIGILKALGATNFEILRIFVIESGLFGLVGGIIGVIVGTLASIALGTISGISMPMMGGRGGFETLVTPQLVTIAVLLSTVIGIVSGLLPARVASKLRPVDALRYE